MIRLSTDPRSLTPNDPRVTCESFVAWILLLLGQADQALAQSRRALAWARELSHAYTLAFALHVNCCLSPTSRRRRDP